VYYVIAKDEGWFLMNDGMWCATFESESLAMQVAELLNG